MTATGDLLLYTDPTGQARVQVRLHEGSLWLSQANIAALYGTTPQNITRHIGQIYAEGELAPEATCKQYLQVRHEGERPVQRRIQHYNLAMILAIGYRVRSPIGTRFRQWATAILAEHAVKGFTLDDQRFKAAGGDVYFDELLARIRDIRSSERVFWRKVLDIYATASRLRRDFPLGRRVPSASSTTTPAPRRRSSSSRPCRTRCIGRRTATPRPRSFMRGPMPMCPTWA